MKRTAVIAFVAALVAGLVVTVLLHAKAWSHTITAPNGTVIDYSKWMRPDTGTSCCNKSDCAPVDAMDVDSHTDPDDVHLRRNGIWISLSQYRDKILPFSSPDGRYHMCGFFWKDTHPTIFCITTPGGV